MTVEGDRPGEQNVEGTESTERRRPQDPAEGADVRGPDEVQAHSQEPAEGEDDPAKTGEG
jgi:hypothetical protein